MVTENDKNVEVVNLPISRVKPNTFNPNTQSEEVFNALVENIQEIGMVEPILVVPDPQSGGDYVVISGEHRLEACRVLGYETVPAIIRQEFDEDMQKFQTVRMNVLKGKLDPVKFTKLFDDMAQKYGEQMTKQMMMFVDDKAFKDVYMSVKKELPKDLQEKLEKTKDEIKTVDDLSRVLNELFSKYGDTLDQNFMVFTYQGKTQLWVRMDKDLYELMIKDVAERLKKDGGDINEWFKLLVLRGKEKAFEDLYR